ncbi:hypothetical protein lpymg_02583 [Legionella pneumophila]|uniref:hypothetical protein n=1 Tax=Legionella pneumophila TaxID=446 RepID=UPI0005C42EB7|nr:hypothetical protein [Legionella pneumophila]GAN27681.1 hypothetical protein lpymg_02583 [Legionella pneumophila]
MDEISSLRDFIFKYFELHANQRINMFRFYSAFIVLYLYGDGYISTHLEKTSYRDEAAGIIVSILFIFITTIFSSLDKRNRAILGNSRAAICYLETKYSYKTIPANELHQIQIFHLDDKDKKTQHHSITHTKCFKRIFWVGYGLSLIVITCCVLRMGGAVYLCGISNLIKN